MSSQVRVSGTAARRALFEAERGICQLCQLDAHTLYQNITALNVRDRPAFLAQTPYSSLPQQMLKKMVMDPKEGMVNITLCFLFVCLFVCLFGKLRDECKEFFCINLPLHKGQFYDIR